MEAVDSVARALAVKAAKGGGGGGTGNYNSLTNRPKVNGVTLSGDKSFADLGLDVITADELEAMWED